MEYPLRNLLADIARNLWSNEVFIGVDVIDRLLFGVIHSGKGSYAVTAFFDLIQNAELHKPGFVLYSLNSFGVLGLGFYRFFTKCSPYLTLHDAGLKITAQSRVAWLGQGR